MPPGDSGERVGSGQGGRPAAHQGEGAGEEGARQEATTEEPESCVGGASAGTSSEVQEEGGRSAAGETAR